MTRDDQLLKIRLEIPQLETKNNLAIESFQNKTLRPILKFQNDLIMSFLHQESLLQKQLKEIPNTDFLEAIIDYLKKNRSVSSLLIGSVIGHLTTDELSFYFNHQKELNKRILGMLGQRYFDNLND